MAVHQYKVYSFQQYIEVVTEIGNAKKIGAYTPPVLWSRGHQISDWNLKPTLLRDVELNPVAGLSNATGRAMEEELRKQHYVARNYHFLMKEPQSDLEWYEVMQHHGVKTRLLDWSESTLHSLIFALECFFDNQKFRKEDRVRCSPCVWILEPINWNMAALEKILENHKLVEILLNEIAGISGTDVNQILMRTRDLKKNLDPYLTLASIGHLKGIFNLSSMVGELRTKRYRDFVELLKNGEIYFCLAYFLTKIYMSEKLQKIQEVMPLSIVESYHSERIRAQKGAFTIFPYYEEDSVYKNAQKLNIQLDAMENMTSGEQFLHKISLCHPEKIAFEVMNAGLNLSWLYPEMPVVANAIEMRRVLLR